MRQKSFLGALLDFSFSYFVTTKLVKFLYALCLGLILLGLAVGAVFALFLLVRGEILQALGMLAALPVIGLIYLIMARVWTELIVVLFRIAENTADLARGDRLGPGEAEV